jgi:Ca2+/Na+ antiporter
MKSKNPKTPEQLIEMEKKFRKSLLYFNLGFSILLWILFFIFFQIEFLTLYIIIQLSIVILWYKMVLSSVDRQKCVIENKPIEIPEPTFLSRLFVGNLFNINLFKKGKDNEFKTLINNFVNRLISFIILIVSMFIIIILMTVIIYFIKKIF